MVVNIRGTSGSGKTTAVRTIVDLSIKAAYRSEAFFREGRKRPITYKLAAFLPGRRPIDTDQRQQDIYILGSYETVCGGCDTIATQDEVCDLIRHYAPVGHVVFEGLLPTYGRYVRLARELSIPYVWAFLDTPLETCLDHVRQRRLARGAEKPLNPENTVSRWHGMRRAFDKCIADGMDARWVDYKTAGDVVFGWLTEASK